MEEQLRVAGLQPKETEAFLNNLKGLIASGNRAGVCSQARYPLVVNTARGTNRIPSEAACQSGYDRIFTPHIIEVIGKQQFAKLQATGRGAMIDNGTVWFASTCQDAKCDVGVIKLSAINH